MSSVIYLVFFLLDDISILAGNSFQHFKKIGPFADRKVYWKSSFGVLLPSELVLFYC